MCGIVGYTGKNKAVPYLLDGLSKLRNVEEVAAIRGKSAKEILG